MIGNKKIKTVIGADVAQKVDALDSLVRKVRKIALKTNGIHWTRKAANYIDFESFNIYLNILRNSVFGN